MNTIKNILYLGWLGEGNVGDDVLFEMFKSMFYKYIDRSKYKYEYNIDGIIYKPGYNYDLNSYDLVVLGGGSLLNLPFWINICGRAKKAGIPVVSWGTGIDGYFTDKAYLTDEYNHIGLNNEQASSIKEIINTFDLLSVRGPITKALLQKLGIPAHKIIEIGDPALFYESGIATENSNKRILVNWGTSNNNILGGDEVKVEEQLETAVQILLNRGYYVTIYPIWINDIPFVQKLGNKFTDNKLTIINQVYNSKQLANLIQNHYLTINIKLHANILSAAVNRPFVSMAYRGKCFDFAKSVECSELVIPTDEINAGKILKCVQNVEDNYNIFIKRFDVAKDRYKPFLLKCFNYIYGLLEGEVIVKSLNE